MGCMFLLTTQLCLSILSYVSRGREDFVALMGKCSTVEGGNQSNNWIMVDSDGEEVRKFYV